MIHFFYIYGLGGSDKTRQNNRRPKLREKRQERDKKQETTQLPTPNSQLPTWGFGRGSMELTAAVRGSSRPRFAGVYGRAAVAVVAAAAAAVVAVAAAAAAVVARPP